MIVTRRAANLAWGFTRSIKGLTRSRTNNIAGTERNKVKKGTSSGRIAPN